MDEQQITLALMYQTVMQLQAALNDLVDRVEQLEQMGPEPSGGGTFDDD